LRSESSKLLGLLRRGKLLPCTLELLSDVVNVLLESVLSVLWNEGNKFENQKRSLESTENE